MEVLRGTDWVRVNTVYVNSSLQTDEDSGSSKKKCSFGSAAESCLHCVITGLLSLVDRYQVSASTWTLLSDVTMSIVSRNFSRFQNFPTGSGAHPASCSGGTWPESEADRFPPTASAVVLILLLYGSMALTGKM